MTTKAQRYKESPGFLWIGFVPWCQKKGTIVLGLIFFLPWILSSCIGKTDESVEYLAVDSLYLIPEPISIEKREGFFKISSQTVLTYSENLMSEGQYFSELLAHSSNFSIQQNLSLGSGSSQIELKLVNDFPAEMQHGEAYKIIISSEKLQITALTETGIMRGIQCLRQLFIPAFHRNEKRDAWYLPCVKIEDRPRFEHRGLMLDVCRHFFDKEVVLKYIDMLAFYRMNILHLHLTEDQGWRIQIDKYPQLNKISSFRTEKDGSVYGGFYTKDDLKEIVAYAAERHIVVIPEIELPGHAQAALAAYPQFSCNGGPIEVVNDWGVFKEIYCAGNDSTFIFIEDVLTEVMEIFPSEYIHIGGDEAPKFRWEHCSKCQQRMNEEALADEHELQSYFIKRIEKFLNSKGRKLIGWDEILEGGLSENASVQSWRGMDGGTAAAQQKHYVVMSPTSHCYLDYGLDAIDVEKVYSFNPIPENLQPEFHKYILGGEVNMWTERVPDVANLDSKIFPRLIALAEVLWSGPDTNRFDHFCNRLQQHYSILKMFGINYGDEGIPFEVNTFGKDGKAWIEFIPSRTDIQLEYWSRECSAYEENEVFEYNEPFELESAEHLTIQAFRRGEKYGEPVDISLVSHDALFCDITYNQELNAYYPASGKYGLVDGQIGSENFRDGNWQGFWGKDLELILSPQGDKKFFDIRFQFLQYTNAWILFPELISIHYRNEKKQWILLNATLEKETWKPGDGEIEMMFYNYRFDTLETDQFKILIRNPGKLASSHEAAGQDSWIFIDEIMIE